MRGHITTRAALALLFLEQQKRIAALLASLKGGAR